MSALPIMPARARVNHATLGVRWQDRATVTGLPEPDRAAARRGADAVLRSIDWSAKDIVIWAPGTGGHQVHGEFATEFTRIWGDKNATLTHLEFPSNWEMQQSVSTGAETLRLVMAGIAAHKGNYRIFLGGESQGSWVIAEVMRDERYNRMIDRAVMLANPSVSPLHYRNGRDPRVWEYANAGDPVASPMKGKGEDVVKAFAAMNENPMGSLPLILKVLAKNPVGFINVMRHLLASQGILPAKFFPDPHNYKVHMRSAVQFLYTGVTPDRHSGV